MQSWEKMGGGRGIGRNEMRAKSKFKGSFQLLLRAGEEQSLS